MMWRRFHDVCDAIRMVSRNRYHRPSSASGMGSGAYTGCLQAQADSPLFGRLLLLQSSSLPLFPPPLTPCPPCVSPSLPLPKEKKQLLPSQAIGRQRKLRASCIVCFAGTHPEELFCVFLGYT